MTLFLKVIPYALQTEALHFPLLHLYVYITPALPVAFRSPDHATHCIILCFFLVSWTLLSAGRSLILNHDRMLIPSWTFDLCPAFVSYIATVFCILPPSTCLCLARFAIVASLIRYIHAVVRTPCSRACHMFLYNPNRLYQLMFVSMSMFLLLLACESAYEFTEYVTMFSDASMVLSSCSQC